MNIYTSETLFKFHQLQAPEANLREPRSKTFQGMGNTPTPHPYDNSPSLLFPPQIKFLYEPCVWLCGIKIVAKIHNITILFLSISISITIYVEILTVCCSQGIDELNFDD